MIRRKKNRERTLFQNCATCLPDCCLTRCFFLKEHGRCGGARQRVFMHQWGGNAQAKMVTDLKIVDQKMKPSDARSIFSEVQDESEASGGPAGAAGAAADDGENETSLSEFHEAIVCVALFKHPHPLHPVHQKVARFIGSTLVPVCKLSLKFGGGPTAGGGGATTAGAQKR